MPLEMIVAIKRQGEITQSGKLAEILKLRPETVCSWINRGVDILYVKIAGTVRFRDMSVQDWLFQKERERKRRSFEH